MRRLERRREASRSFPQVSWAEILQQTVADSFSDHAHRWAAAVAFYALISLFPLALLAVSGSAYFVEPAYAIKKVTAILADYLPEAEGTIKRAIQEAYKARGAASLISVPLLLWTGTRIFAVMTVALNVVYGVPESYSFRRRMLIEVFMLLTIGLLFLLAATSGLILEALGIGVLAQRSSAIRALAWVVQAVLLMVVFFAMYRFLPRGRQGAREALVGAVTATCLFLLARLLFSYYFYLSLSRNLIYGSLGAAIIILVWTWVVAVILLFGGELASHYKMMRLEGRSAEEVRRFHERWSPPQKRDLAR